jgi:hypothetical protein
MAQITKLVDDIDGTDAEMTLEFGLDGVEYAIDLNDEHYEEHRAALEFLASKGRVVVREAVKVKRAATGAKGKPVVGKTQHIREWARENGFPNLSDRGRIPQNIMDAYETRSRMPIAAPETPAEVVEEAPKGDNTPDVNVEEQKAIEKVKANPAKLTTRAKRTPAKGKQVEIPALREVLTLVDGE